MAKIDVKTALSRIWLEQLDEMVARTGGASAGVDSEELHKFRVALRKTRALRKLFAPYLPDFGAFDDDFRWLAEITSPVRDLDVLLQQQAQLPAALGVAAEDLAPAFALLQRERDSAQRSLQRALRSRRWQQFAQRWRAFAADELTAAQSPITLCIPARTLANTLLLQRCLQLLRAARRVDPYTPPTTLHSLRIRGKRIRYLLEALAPFAGKKWGKALPKKLVQLQDVLGTHQDAIAIIDRLRPLADRIDSAPARDALQQWLNRVADDRDRARAQIPKRLERFAAACAGLA